MTFHWLQFIITLVAVFSNIFILFYQLFQSKGSNLEERSEHLRNELESSAEKVKSLTKNLDHMATTFYETDAALKVRIYSN